MDFLEFFWHTLSNIRYFNSFNLFSANFFSSISASVNTVLAFIVITSCVASLSDTIDLFLGLLGMAVGLLSLGVIAPGNDAAPSAPVA